MNWINALYDLYDKNKDIAGKIEERSRNNGNIQKLILLPLSHSTALAQIEVTIDSSGNFMNAKTVEKDDAITIIPVSEGSACRTSSPAPHPLCDNLKYIAKDYENYFENKKKEKKNKKGNTPHQDYMASLEKWCKSAYSHPKAIAIYNYLKKGTIIRDLIEQKVLIPDEDGNYSDKVKIQGYLK